MILLKLFKYVFLSFDSPQAPSVYCYFQLFVFFFLFITTCYLITYFIFSNKLHSEYQSAVFALDEFHYQQEFKLCELPNGLPN